MAGPWSFKTAKRIRRAERDRELSLDPLTWPQPDDCPKGWELRDGHIARTIKATKDVLPVGLDESILRFPSAPVHSLHRMQEHHVDLKESENLHSYRILRSDEREIWDQPVARIFLMHTGLNERDTMGVYYRLASNLIEKEPSTVCIVRPFPGHLTRFPFAGFAETPLDRYLWDGSHLFRQFVRHMIETQWFLSVLARRSFYRYASGANLLAESNELPASRLETDVLAEKMRDVWLKIHKQSNDALAETLKKQPRAIQVKAPPEVELFESAIDSLRGLLNLTRDYPGRTGDPSPDEVVQLGAGADEPSTSEQSPELGDEGDHVYEPDEQVTERQGDHRPVDPPLHVIGYSLGGFTAQSVFMSWPFLVSSCCTLLGAGALRDMAPSTFAHPEEWQTVLHSLRYELDDRMMGDEIGAEHESVAGIDGELFTFFKRTFYEVFEQNYRGSIQTRLAAFRKRMLFVVGGNDPIVPPENVINSSPPGGLNLVEVGGLSHFLDGSPEDQEESQQRLFWVPEVVALLSDFADGVTRDQARERRFTVFDADMERPLVSQQAFEHELLDANQSTTPSSPRVQPLAATELLSIESDGALPGASFERCLDDLLVRVESTSPKEDGVLFVLRNELPTMILPDSLVRERAAALYHDDFGIVRYCHGIKTRRAMVEESIERICLVFPWNVGHTHRNMDAHRGYPSQSETAGGQVRERATDEAAWEACLVECKKFVQGDGRQSIRSFDGGPILQANNGRLTQDLRMIAEEFVGREQLTRVPALPDCWVWVSRDVLGTAEQHKLTIDRAIQDLCHAVPNLCAGKGKSWEPALLGRLQTGKIRIVTVSRARYNPRFRGRLIVTPKSARSLLVHVALCLALSDPTENKNLSKVFT